MQAKGGNRVLVTHIAREMINAGIHCLLVRCKIN
jgi:hypothetical protein